MIIRYHLEIILAIKMIGYLGLVEETTACSQHFQLQSVPEKSHPICIKTFRIWYSYFVV